MLLVAVVVCMSDAICVTDDNDSDGLLFNISDALIAATALSVFCIQVGIVCDDDK